MPGPLAVTEEQFREALVEAIAMSADELRNAAGSGTSRSYFVRSGDRILPLKAVLRLSYRRGGVDWDGPQSSAAADELKDAFDILYIEPADEDARLERQRENAERWMRDGKFRSSVLELYGAKCLISGCDVLEAIDAAHVCGVADAGSDKPTNGMLLRTDIHRLFDAYLMSIDPTNGTVQVADSCSDAYGAFAGTAVRLPEGGPKLSDFATHFTRFMED